MNSTKTLWQRNLAVLWVGELIAIAGFSVTLPFLPYYVQELGITGTSEVAFWAGLLTTCQATTMALVAPVWGSLADRYGRKVMVMRAMFGGAVVIAAMGLTQNVWQLAVLRAIQGTLTGTVPAATTLVASSAPPEKRGYALGLLQMAIYLGSSVGPFLGGMIAARMGYRATFWVTGGLLFVAGLLVMAFVHEGSVASRQEGKTEEQNGAERADSSQDSGGTATRTRLWDGLLVVYRTRALMMVFGIRVLMRTAVRIVGPVLPLFIQQIAAPGVGSASHTQVASLAGTITGTASATSAAAAVLLGRVSDKIGYRRILLICGSAACALYGLQAWVQTPAQLLILRALSGAAMGGVLSSVSALLAALAPKDRFGAVYGVDTSMVAAANAVAPLIGATLVASFGLSSVFLGAAAMFALATAAVAAIVPRSKSKAATSD